FRAEAAVIRTSRRRATCLAYLTWTTPFWGNPTLRPAGPAATRQASFPPLPARVDLRQRVSFSHSPDGVECCAGESPLLSDCSLLRAPRRAPSPHPRVIPAQFRGL